MAFAASLLAFRASSAHASPLFDLTGDLLGKGGLQAGSVASSAAAAYFNPALLTQCDAGLEIGFVLLSQQIGITLAGRPGPQYAVPSGVANAGHADGSRFDNYPIPTNDLQFGREGDELRPGFTARPRQGAGSGHGVFTYQAIGLTAQLFDERLALGFYGLIPHGEFTQLKAFYNDEREQYFSNSLHPELYGDRLTAPSLAFGAGLRVLDNLSIGVGATLNLQAEVVAPTYVVDTGDLGAILIDMDTSVNVSVAPHFGILYASFDERLRLSATAHAPKSVTLGTKFTFLLANGVEQESGIDFILNYVPWQASFGVAGDIVRGPEQTLTVAGTVSYARWSDYIDRHGDRPSPAYAWSDTFSPALGVRYSRGIFNLSADTTYVPTPVPRQTGRSNYVDNDRLAASLGGEIGFSMWGTSMHLGLLAQAHHLLSRSQWKLPTPTDASGDHLAPELVKDEVPDDAQIGGDPLEEAEGLQTNNPGWPGFGSQGWVLASSIYLRVAL